MQTQFTPQPIRMPSDLSLAEKLGLTLGEFQELSHTGIREIMDCDGNVMSYYIIINPVNPEYLLHKLNMDENRIVYFAPDAFD